MHKQVKGSDIRKAFLQFFQQKGHTVLPSSSLVPQDDPTLLFASAGMVQIKPYFLGLATPPNRRLASCQKCFRTSDIESVGDSKHLTFFEMLGNFSVGDYFKKEAIEWAWEFITRWLKLSQERLWVTVFLDDDEAAAYWQQIGICRERIVRLGEKDNFWGPAGESGPCGPCSEIHYDFGEDKGCGRPGCDPSCECSRFSEIWNLVFTEYNQDREGTRTRLPKPNIDTGMGLERISAVMQGKSTVYETDLFAPLVENIAGLTSRPYGRDETVDRALRIIAEHARGSTFLIADGVVPGNEGRGYVLRRIVRRASMFGRKLGLEDGFLGSLADTVIDAMGDVYPELKGNRKLVLGVLGAEEQRFNQALGTGLNVLDRIIEKVQSAGRRTISGQDIFMLYDTYGFPKELTAEIAGEQGFALDLSGFEEEMERQRERARAAHRFGLGEQTSLEVYEKLPVTSTRFAGYQELHQKSRIMALIKGGNPVESAAEGDTVEIVLDETPFYGEMGGQVGDTGEIRSEQGRAAITQASRPLPEMTVHLGEVVAGVLRAGALVEVEVEAERRMDIARNHTATHLLQAALRIVLGDHVRQSGSLVAPDRFRFDFTHLEAVGKEQLLRVQRIVNQKIRENIPVRDLILSYQEALSRGATALFGEKYGDQVRVVQVGEPAFSVELCGGTHVSYTGQIGMFHLISESSIGSGLRRIEAATGRGAEAFIEERLTKFETAAVHLDSKPEELPERIIGVLEELDRARKRSQSLERELARNMAGPLTSQAKEVDGTKVVAVRIEASSAEVMREVGDRLKEELGSGVVVLGAVYNDKVNFLVMVTSDLVAKGVSAGDIARRVAKEAGGGGGGRAELGQGSGKDTGKIEQALGLVEALIPH